MPHLWGEKVLPRGKILAKGVPGRKSRMNEILKEEHRIIREQQTPHCASSQSFMKMGRTGESGVQELHELRLERDAVRVFRTQVCKKYYFILYNN